jgi:hypothetical protein
MRRIERRKGVHQLDSTKIMFILQENPNEIQLLSKS